jgi:hypothetical protein
MKANSNEPEEKNSIITLKQKSNNSIIMAENKELKECQLCHQMLPISSFYKKG